MFFFKRFKAFTASNGSFPLNGADSMFSKRNHGRRRSSDGGNTGPTTKYKATNGFEFLQLPQLPLEQIGYPQAQNWIEHRKANIRPWSLFVNTNNIRPPPNITRLSKRIVKNIEYFQSNYLFVFVGLVIYCLITSPLLLLTVVAYLGICYKLSQRHSKQELTILNMKLTLAQVYSLVGICSLPVFYLVGAHAAVFWVLGVSWFLITLHAAFYNIDAILCPGEEELNALVQVV